MLRSIAVSAVFATTASALPNYHGCTSALAKSFKYCDSTLSHAERVESLLGQLTLEEKAGLISPDPILGNPCFAHIRAVPSADLPEYGWLVEVNTGVASSCIGPNQCATTYSGPTGLAAAFNRSMWAKKGEVLSTEMRAFSNANWYRTGRPPTKSQPTVDVELIGTSAFGPNLNMIRDPRYGRNSELPGEDPYLTGEYGVAMVSAMQATDANGHPRVNAFLKHFDAYSTETNRMHSDFNITMFDFMDTYLPQYKKVFTVAKAAGAMCSYTAENGVPSCTNGWLLNDVLRKQWGREDAHITTDCGAVRNTMGPPLNLKTPEEAAAATINGGTDLEMGTTIWNSSLLSAVAKGLVTEATITTAARRSLLSRMTQGDFDPVNSVAWASIGKEVINSTEHQAAAYDAALQSMVLLRNTGVLPLKAGSKIAVVGPGAIAQQGLVGPYFGDSICYAPHEFITNRTYECIPTVGSQIDEANVGGSTVIRPGVNVTGSNTSWVAAALAAVDAAEVVVLAVGLDHTVEHEGVDVANLSLPGLQESFAEQVLGKGKPTVLVLMGNDGTGIDRLVSRSAAIVRAFYPATHGSKALASLLFGTENRWGKLPVTMYPEGYVEQLPQMGAHTGTAYAMSHAPGRSYRYYTGTPLFQFGEGLSLTTFSLACTPAALLTLKSANRMIDVTCTVTNTGAVVGDEVVFVYHAVGDSIRQQASKLHPVPLKQLVEFSRVGGLEPQASTTTSFSLNASTALSLTTADGTSKVYPGDHTLIFSTGVPGVPDVIHHVTV